jgi:hypothetical protein
LERNESSSPRVRLYPLYPAVVFSLWTGWVLQKYAPHSIRPFLDSWQELLPQHMSFLAALVRCVQQPWAADLAIALVLTVAAIGAGGWILDRLGIARHECTPLDRVTFSAAAGFAALVIMASALGVFHLFHPLPLRILLVAFTVAGLVRLRWEAPALRAFVFEVGRGLAREPLAFFPLAFSALFCWFALMSTAAPETAFDAVMVYLPYPREFLQRGTFSLIELYRGNIPLYGVVFFSLGQVFHADVWRGEAGARMLNYLTLPGVLLATAALARTACRNLSRPVFYIALAVSWTATCPVLWYHASICYPDLGVAMWSTLAVLATMRLLEHRSRGWALLAGLCAGMSAGMKFSGMYWVAMCGLAILIGYAFFTQAEERLTTEVGTARLTAWAFAMRQRLREGLRVGVLFGVVATVVFVPWLIRNWINTGDPMHPTFQRSLRHPAMDPDEARDVLHAGLNPQRVKVRWINLVQIPWLMTFGNERFVGTIGPVLLWSLPFLFLGWRRDRYWLLLAFLFPLFGLFWLIGPQWVRYFLPGIPLSAVLGASALANMRFPRWLTVYLGLLGMCMVLPNLPGMQQALAVGTAGMPENVPYDPALGVQSRGDYLRRNLEKYEASQYANTLGLPSSTAVLAAPVTETLPAWYTQLRIVDIWDNFRLVCRDENDASTACYSTTPEILLHHLDRAGIGLLAIRHSDLWVRQVDRLRLEDPLLRSAFRLRGYRGNVFFFERDRQAPRPGQDYLQADLLNRWVIGQDAVSLLPDGQPRALPPDEPGVFHGVATVRAHRDDLRLTLMMDSTGLPSATWKITPGRGARLSFFLTRKEWSGIDPGDLLISVDNQVVSKQPVEEREILERWRPVEVDLSRWAGKPITLTLTVQARKPGTTIDLPIGDPVVYAKEDGERR